MASSEKNFRTNKNISWIYLLVDRIMTNFKDKFKYYSSMEQNKYKWLYKKYLKSSNNFFGSLSVVFISRFRDLYVDYYVL